MTNNRPYRARRLRAFALGVAAAGALLTAAAPASAEQSCRYDGLTFNACLTLVPSASTFTPFWSDAEVGLDRVMPMQYAREILSFPCNPDFRAELWGEDGATDERIGILQIDPGYPTTMTNGGLSAGFSNRFGPLGRQLDEDPGENIDEVYAKISYVDCHIGPARQTFDTGLIVRDFSNHGR
jgi:hypothetical protein